VRHVKLERVDAGAMRSAPAATNASRIASISPGERAAGGASCAECVIADGATGCHPPSAGAISLPPAQGTAELALRPACASCIATGIAGACCRARASVIASAVSHASS
jgi:hypothetical protein